MSKIEEGTRVKVRHDPERDGGYLPTSLPERRAHNGEIGCVAEGPRHHARFRVRFDDGGAWYDLAELTPVETVEPSARVKIGQAVDNVDRALDEERAARRAAIEAARSETTLVRADLEALQAAVRGVTGKEGTVADMVSDLADVGRSNDVAMVAALRRDRDDARNAVARASLTIVTAREAYEALRAEVQSGGRSWIAAHPGWERLGRALRGEKAPQEPESKPAHIAGPWVEISPGERRRRDERSPLLFAASIGPHLDDPKVLIWCAHRPEGGTFAERDTALDPQAAKDACDAALRRIGWTLRDSEPAKDPQAAAIEAIATTVESVSNNVIALEQQIAGLGNGLDEVRDPAWFAARFREHMTRHGFASVDAASVADERPRVSWRWADGATAGWLTTVTGEQIAGAHEGNDGWYWWCRAGGRVGGPMSREDAIWCAEKAASKIAVIVR